MADQDGVARKIYDEDDRAIRVSIISGGTGGTGGGSGGGGFAFLGDVAAGSDLTWTNTAAHDHPTSLTVPCTINVPILFEFNVGVELGSALTGGATAASYEIVIVNDELTGDFNPFYIVLDTLEPGEYYERTFWASIIPTATGEVTAVLRASVNIAATSGNHLLGAGRNDIFMRAFGGAAGGTGGGGAVDSVDGETGVVDLTDNYQPLDSDLTAISALATTTYGRSLLTTSGTAALTTEIDTFTSSLDGLAPSSGGGTTNFLRADGTWTAPAGGGGGGITSVDGDTGPAVDLTDDYQPLDTELTDIAALTRTRGDLIIGGTSAWTDLAVGTSGTILRSDGTDPTWTSLAGAGIQALDTDLTAIAALTRSRGDLIVGGASAWQDLAVGAAGTVLTSDGTDPSWQTPTGGGSLDADLTAIAALTRTRGDLIVGGASDWVDLAISATAGALLRGNGTDPAWVTDVALANGTYSSGAITGGNVTNGNSFRVDRTYTTTAEPADLSVGTPFYANQNVTLNHAGAGSGPNASTSFYGPRTAFNNEGRYVYNVNTTAFTFSTPGFGDFAITKNQPSSAKTITPAWSYIAGRTYLADGATVTMSQTDASPGGAAFFDAVIFATANTGTFSGSSHTYSSYISSPFVVGNTTLGGRIAYEVRDINDYYIAPGLSGAESLADGLLTEPVDTTATPTITIQYGVHIPALTGATTNYGVYSLTQNVLAGIYGSVSSGGTLNLQSTTHATRGTIELDAPTTEVVVTNYTNTAATYKTLVNDATITMNATSGSFHGVEWSPQVAFQQDGNVVGGGVTFRDDTIYRNVGGVSGVDIGPVYSFWASPTLRTQNGTSTVSDFYGFTSGYTTDQVTAGTMTVTNSTNFQATGPIVGANTTVGTHRGLHVTQATVTGVMVAQVGVDIGTLAGAVLNVGIRNASTSILKDTVYGGDTASADLTFQSTTHSTKGDVVLDNPTVIFGTDNYGSQSSGGHLTLHSTTHATAGDIQLHNPTTELVVANYTNTAATYAPLFLDATITMDASGGGSVTGNKYIGINHAPTIIYEQAGDLLAGSIVFKDATTYTNPSGEANDSGIIVSFNAGPILNNNTLSTTTGAYVGFNSGPALSRTTGGTKTVTTLAQFQAAAPTVPANTAVTTRIGVNVANGASANIGTNIGIDIANQTLATTANIGIRNAGTLRQSNSATFGANADATWRIHLQGGNAATAAIGMDTSTTGPTTHGTNSGGGTMSIYKGATNWYFLIAFNDAGTQRYRYMQLNGTAATWTHGTTLPT